MADMVTPGESGFDPKTAYVFAEDGGGTRNPAIAKIRGGDGWLVGVYSLSGPTHSEMHPAGAEILYLVSGAVDVVLEEEGGERVIELEPGTACIVPCGVWHRQIVHEPSDLLAITYGKGTQHR